MTIKQKQGESFQDYLRNFNKVMLEVPSLKKRVALEAVKQAVLWNSPFYLSILKVKIGTFKQIREKAEKYILQENALSSCSKNKQQWGNEGNNSNNKNNIKKRDKDRIGLGGDRFAPQGRDQRMGLYLQFTEYTPLRKPQVEILMKICNHGNANVLPTPTRMKPNPKRIKLGK